MANYSPSYPTNVSVDTGIKEFITTFYGVSDTPGKNQEWVDFFRDDATLVMEKKEATGKTGKRTHTYTRAHAHTHAHTHTRTHMTIHQSISSTNDTHTHTYI